MNVPQLRFSGFDGEWRSISLGEVLKESKEVKRGKSKLPIATSSRKGLFLQSDYFNGKRSYDTDDINFKVVPRGFVTYRHMSDDSTFHFNINQLADEILVSPEYPVFTTTENADINFILYHLNSHDNFKNFCIMQKLGGTRTRLYFKKLQNYKLFIPKIEEQHAVSNFLQLLSKRIGKQEEKIDNLEQFKKGVMQKIFSQELRFKDEDGGEFKEWEETLFGEVVTNKTEKLNPQKETIVLPCIELENIEQGSGQLIGNIDNGDQQSMKNKFDKGSVLFGKLRPYLKKYFYTNFDGLCSTEIWVLNSKESRLINGFIYFFIQGTEFLEAANKSIGSKMPRADWNSVSELPFKVPTVKEQRKIVNYLNVLENKIVKEKEKLMVLEEQKRGFMQGMLV